MYKRQPLSGGISRGLAHRRSRRPVFANVADGTLLLAETDPVSYTHLDVYKRQTYYLVGRSLTAATGAGDRLEVEPCLPVRLTVAAVLRTDTVAHLAADVSAALVTPGLVKILTS